MKTLLTTCLIYTALTTVPMAGETIKVASLSTVLAEIVERVGGDRVTVTALVKAGVDPHEFEPKPEDLKMVAGAQLVLASGKNLEGYFPKLKESAGAKADLIAVGDKLPSIKMKTSDHDHKEHAGHKGELIEDPHWWQSITNVKLATKIVRDELIKLSPSDTEGFKKNADAYIVQLNALEKWVKLKLAELPRDRRKLVTSHDAFGYFANEYGFNIYAIKGFSSEDEPSSKDVAEACVLIKTEGVKAIFPHSMENPKVLREITRETGAVLGGELYADGLGTGDASTYEGMIKHNVGTIVDALK